MKLILRKLEDPYEWDINGRIFRTSGLYMALDMALALSLGQTNMDNLPDLPWTHNKTNNTYEMEL